MEKFIIKRDGRVVPYNREKIENAMRKAFISTDNSVDEYGERKIQSITDFIENRIKSDEKRYSVEEIQDMVENGLMNTKRHDVAREYITYRHQRSLIREKNSPLMIETGKKIHGNNEEKANANVDAHSFGGRAGEARNVITKRYACDYLLSDKVKYNHENNRIYIHDLDNYALGNHNCLSIPFDKLLREGFDTRQTDIRAANSISTAFQLLAVIFQLQSLQQFGGCSATHLDWTMVPFFRLSFFKHYKNGLKYIYDADNIVDKISRDTVMDTSIEDRSLYKKDQFPRAYEYAMDLTIKETNQAVEAMYHNLNSLQSRSGNQLPFTSINYGTCTLIEGRIVIRSLLEGSIKGIGKLHRTSVFPCGIFQCMKGVNRKPGDPNYDLFRLALKSTSKRLYPKIA